MTVALKDASYSPSHSTDKRFGYVFACCATVCWSCTGLFIDAITSHYSISSVNLSFWRSLIVVIALGLFLLRGSAKTTRISSFGISWREVPFYLVYGVIGVGVFNLTWNNSVVINKAAVATSLLFCSPVFVVFGARWLFHEKIRLPGIIAIVLDLTGVFLVAGVYNFSGLANNTTGLIYAVGSGLTFATYTLCGKLASRNSPRSSSTTLFYAFAFGLAGLFLWGLWQEGGGLFQVNLDLGGWILLVLLALGPTLGGYAFFNLAIHRLEAGVVSIFTTLEPPITAVLAWLLLGRVLNLPQWAGAFLIVLGVLILQSGGRFKFPFRK